MSKVICEICGTAYPSTDAQCPVCGFEKPVTAEFADAFSNTGAVAENTRQPAPASKGGRYTKSNVNKRMKTSGKSGKPDRNTVRKPKGKKRKKSNGGMVALLIFLILAILAVGGYLLVKYVGPNLLQGDDTQPQQSSDVQTDPPVSTTVQTDPLQTQPTTEATEPDLSCTGLKLSESAIRFNKPGNAWLLNVIPTPANTTDPITYYSEDETVATVDTLGRVVAVGAGETVVVITCGDVTITCAVSCKEGPAPTEPEDTKPDDADPDETEPEETKPVDTGDFKLNREDFSLAVGESWQLYNGSIDASEITWSSSNTSVATVNNGRVKGVGKGQAWITAEYNGVKLKCIVYVN